jgi:hypothetical protein
VLSQFASSDPTAHGPRGSPLNRRGWYICTTVRPKRHQGHRRTRGGIRRDTRGHRDITTSRGPEGTAGAGGSRETPKGPEGTTGGSEQAARPKGSNIQTETLQYLYKVIMIRTLYAARWGAGTRYCTAERTRLLLKQCRRRF